jgi:hypothetical protein
MALMSSANRRFSPWVLVMLAVAIVVCFAVGGGLVSVFYSCAVGVDATTFSCSLATYQAGLFFLSLGSLASLSWFVLLIVFFVSRPPPRPHVMQYNNMRPAPGNVAAVVPNAQQLQQQQQSQPPHAMPPQYYGAQQPVQNYYGAPAQYPAAAPLAPGKEAFVVVQPVQQMPPAPPYPIQELEAPVPTPAQQHSERRCGRCEAIMHSPFCQRCGSGVAAS